MTVANGSLRLSAVVPNFNHGAMISEAIRAVAAQEPAADEIIVVDDGSTDNSIKVLERLGREFPTLRVIRLKENRGAIFAMNRGLRESRGKYINFCAADDLPHPGLFAAMLAALNLHPQAAFACCEAVVVDTETRRVEYRPPVRPSYTEAYFGPDEVAGLLRRIDNWILTGTALVRRDFISDLGGFDATLGPFGDGFLFRKLALAHGFCFVPRLGHTWRVSPTGLSRSKAANPADSLTILASALERMRADPDFPPWYPEILERRWRFGIGMIAANGRPMNRAALTKLARGSICEAIIIAATAFGGPIGRIVALAWLTVRYRPTSLVGLVRTGLARRLSKSWREGRGAFDSKQSNSERDTV